MKKILPIIIAIIVAGGIGFYIGTKSGQSPNSKTASGQANYQNFQAGGGAGARRGGLGQNGGFTGGQIVAKDDKSMTVSLQNGGSKIVLFSSSTSVMKTAQGTLDDLTVGKGITVTGSANSDGSITAQSVQVRPAQPAPGAKTN